MSDPTAKPLAPVATPDLAALLDAHKNAILMALNSHLWGTVQSFDPAKQTVSVQVGALRLVPQLVAGVPEYVAKPYPILMDVPVMIASGGDGFLTFPIKAGDTCLVLFNDRDMDAFWTSGTPAVPGTGRLHDLSDGLAIVGFRTMANLLPSYDAAQVVLALADTKLVLGDKIGLANADTDLLTVLTNLITTLKAWVNTGGSTPNAATITALTANQTEIDQLLQ